MNRRWLYLFPPGWRRDYGLDLAETLSSVPLSASVVFDLVDGAADAWMSALAGSLFHRGEMAGGDGPDGGAPEPSPGGFMLLASAARHRGPVWAVAASGWSLLFIVGALLLPYQYTESGGPGEMTRSATYTLAAAKGFPFVAVLYGIPLVLSVTCLVASQLALRRDVWWPSAAAWACVALSWAAFLLTIPKIGISLIPVPVLLTVGTAGPSFWGRAGQLLGRSAWGLGSVAWGCFAIAGAAVFPYHETVVRSVTRGPRGLITAEGTGLVSHSLIATKGTLVLLFPLGTTLLLALAGFAAMWLASRPGRPWAHHVTWILVGLAWVDFAFTIPTVAALLLPVPVLLTLGAARAVRWPAFATRSPGAGWALAAAAWSFLLLLGALLLPFYETGSSTLSAGGRYISDTSTSTLFSAGGYYALLLVGVPLLLSVVCFVALRAANGRPLRWSFVAIGMSVGLVWLECLFGLLSIGQFLIPVAVLLTVGASRLSRATKHRSALPEI